MGGAVALGLAVDRPDVVADRVSAIVVVNSSREAPADRLLARARVAVLDWSVTEQVGRHPRHGLVVARASFGAEPRRSHVMAVRTIGFASPAARRRASPGDCWASTSATGSARLAFRSSPSRGADRVLAPSESDRIVASVDGARLKVFTGAGHMLPVERSRRGRTDPAARRDAGKGLGRRASAARRTSSRSRRSWSLRLLVVDGAALRMASASASARRRPNANRSKPRMSNAEVSHWPRSRP